MREPKVYPSGDQALTLQFGNAVDPVINDQVRALAEAITHKKIPGVLELVPTFCSLTVYYDPLTIKYGSLAMEIRRLAAQAETAEEKSGRLLKIPCCYGARFGPDLADMEKHTGLYRDEIIAIHSSTDYKVYMLGFLPGFVYLGGLDPRLHIPRLSVPRLKIPKGAVGIGGSQTGVYPLDSPGGWRLIGGTPVDFYDPGRSEPVLCRPGDYIRFVSVTILDYYDIRQMILRGTYKIDITERGSQA